MRDAMRVGVSSATAAQWMDEAFRTVNSNLDTHPCLAARRSAMGCHQHVPNATTPWCGAAQPSAAEARLESIDAAGTRAAAEVEIVWDKALTIMDLHGDAAAEPLLRQVLVLRPSHPGANFYLGSHLLSLGDEKAVGHISRSMEEDESLTPQASEMLLIYFRRLGNTGKIREIEARLDAYEAASQLAAKAGAILSATDTFLAHELTEEQLEPLRKLLRGEPRLISADLARKAMPPDARGRLFVLSLHPKHRFLSGPDPEEARAIANRLFTQVRLPGRLLIIGPTGTYRAVARKIAAMSGVEVYRH